MNQQSARRLDVVLLLCLFLPAGSICHAQLATQTVNANSTNATQESVLTPLELDKPIERQLKAGESHSYQIALAPKQFLNVVVEQRGVDVTAVLFSLDGKKLSEVNDAKGPRAKQPNLVTARVGLLRYLESAFSSLNTIASASSNLPTFLPPPWAMSGFPPPRPSS